MKNKFSTNEGTNKRTCLLNERTVRRKIQNLFVRSFVCMQNEFYERTFINSTGTRIVTKIVAMFYQSSEKFHLPRFELKFKNFKTLKNISNRETSIEQSTLV